MDSGPDLHRQLGGGTANESSQEIANLNIVLGRVNETPQGQIKSKISAVMCSFSCRHNLEENKEAWEWEEQISR